MVLKLVPFEIYLYLRWLVKIPVFLMFVFLSVWRENESQRWVALFRGEPLIPLGVIVNGASGPRTTQLIPALCRMALNVQSRL